LFLGRRPTLLQEGDFMIGLQSLASLAGASLVTSAAYYLVGRLSPKLRTPLTAIVCAELVVFVGAALAAPTITPKDAVLLFLNGLVVAATSLGGVHALTLPDGGGTKP
jgi:hypothetical protein